MVCGFTTEKEQKQNKTQFHNTVEVITPTIFLCFLANKSQMSLSDAMSWFLKVPVCLVHTGTICTNREMLFSCTFFVLVRTRITSVHFIWTNWQLFSQGAVKWTESMFIPSSIICSSFRLSSNQYNAIPYSHKKKIKKKSWNKKETACEHHEDYIHFSRWE